MYGVDHDHGGNCHHFIKSLIIYNLVRDTSVIDFYNGTAHHYVEKMNRSDVIACHIVDINDIKSFDKIFNCNNFKYIKIYFTNAEDLKISVLFHFIKSQGLNYGFSKPFEQLDAEKTKKFFNDVYLPKNTFFNVKKTVLDDSHPYKTNIYWLDFHDILYNKEKTINLIQKVTGLQANSNLHENYDRYLSLQYQIISKFS